jgi:hypothetical protein
MPSQCEGVVIAQLESQFSVENGLMKWSQEVHSPIGLYTDRLWYETTRR